MVADPRGAAASPATDAAAELLDEFIAQGLTDVVVAPGSRSQALALAAADLDARGRVRLHVRLDERSAGFFALGLARLSGRPAAVVVTSGTAVGNLLPAVMEAHHSGVPMLLLTADRPPELRGVGANQATVQPGIFDAFVRYQHDAPVPTAVDAHPHRALARDAWRAAVGVPAGPAHLNLPFREPLAGAFPAWWHGADRTGLVMGVDDAADDEVAWGDGARTILVAGADATPGVGRLAADLSWPLVAEITSGARVGSAVVADYRAALRDPALGGAVERVVVVGHPTLTREVTALLKRADVDVVAVRGPGERLNLNGRTHSISAAALRERAVAGDGTWASRWTRSTPADAPSGVLDRAALVGAVWEASAADDRVVWGSSRLVRVADDTLPARDVAVFANRGLAGIDGTIASTCGIAAAASTGITRLVIGDLAFLHDAGSLLQPADEPTPAVQIIVGNDGGGTIFDTLEVSRVASADAFARVQYTPQHVDVAALCRAYGWDHVRVTTPADLRRELASRRPHVVIEAPLPR